MNLKKLLALSLVMGLTVTSLSVAFPTGVVYAEPESTTETTNQVQTIIDENGEERELTEEELEAIRKAEEEAAKEAKREETRKKLAEIEEVPGEVNIYRICHTDTQEHLYSTDQNEVIQLSALGWRFEGLGWRAPKEGDPIFRLFLPGGYHIYTSNMHEIYVLTTEHGWEIDNGGRAIFYSGGEFKIPRMYNQRKNLHLLTSDGNEARMLNLQPAWEIEESTIRAASLPNQKPVEQVKVIKEGDADLSNTEVYYGIEADVNLDGVGTGYHSKLVICTALSAVSFGLQFDQYAQDPYANRTNFIVENIHSNNEGGQHYTRYGEAKLDTTYHLMLTIDRLGNAKCYINGDLVAEVNNPELAYAPDLYMRCEASGRKNGDYVKAEFSNISLRYRGFYRPDKEWEIYEFESNPGIVADFPSLEGGVIKGTIQGFMENEDWDSAYEVSSGIIQFVE